MREKKRLATKKWRAENQAADNAKTKARNKTKEAKAAQMVRDQVKQGYMRKPSACMHCDKKGLKGHAIQAHHTDYDKPLEVLWLCHDCHGHQHTKENAKKVKH